MKIKNIVKPLAMTFLAVSLAVPTNVYATNSEPSDWAKEMVERAISLELVPSDLQTSYTETTTRAEFCSLAVNLYEVVADETIDTRKTFEDTTDENVEKIASVGIVQGVGNNKFAPNENLTREQAAVMLSVATDVLGKPIESSNPTFSDTDTISNWALTGCGKIQTVGIMKGVGNNKFAPQDPYTREQSIVTILLTYDYLMGTNNEISQDIKKDSPGEEPTQTPTPLATPNINKSQSQKIITSISQIDHTTIGEVYIEEVDATIYLGETKEAVEKKIGVSYLTKVIAGRESFYYYPCEKFAATSNAGNYIIYYKEGKVNTITINKQGYTFQGQTIGQHNTGSPIWGEGRLVYADTYCYEIEEKIDAGTGVVNAQWTKKTGCFAIIVSLW